MCSSYYRNLVYREKEDKFTELSFSEYKKDGRFLAI